MNVYVKMKVNTILNVKLVDNLNADANVSFCKKTILTVNIILFVWWKRKFYGQ